MKTIFIPLVFEMQMYILLLNFILRLNDNYRVLTQIHCKVYTLEQIDKPKHQIFKFLLTFYIQSESGVIF